MFDGPMLAISVIIESNKFHNQDMKANSESITKHKREQARQRSGVLQWSEFGMRRVERVY